MEHPVFRAAGDAVAWGLLAAAVMGYITKLAVVLGVIWHLCQLYQFFEKRINKKKHFKRRASDKL